MVLNEVRSQCIQYTIMLLQDFLHLDDNECKSFVFLPHKNNPLLQIMLKRDLPAGFLTEMVASTHHNSKLFFHVSITFFFKTYMLLHYYTVILKIGFLSYLARTASDYARFIDGTEFSSSSFDHTSWFIGYKMSSASSESTNMFSYN